MKLETRAQLSTTAASCGKEISFLCPTMDEKPNELSEMMDEDQIKFQPKHESVFLGFSKGKILLFVLSIVALIALLVGIVLIALSFKNEDCKDHGRGNKNGKIDDGQASFSAFCDYSVEAKRIKLDEVLRRVKNSYYDNHPFQLPTESEASRDEIKKKYSAYNPTPEYIKQVTDSAWRLLDELKQIHVDSDKLKARERKALSQLKQYLKVVYGQPYDMNYYTGHWMMGPTFFCHRQGVCQIRNHVSGLLKSLKPESLDDVSLLEIKIKPHKEGILRYIENLRLGKLHGMVYNQEACIASTNAIKAMYLQTSLKNETG